MISKSLIFPSRLLALGSLLLLFATITAADYGIQILSSSDQLVTSSTLRWVPHTQLEAKEYDNLVIGGLELLPKTEENDAASGNNNGGVVSRPIYVCRAIDNGMAMSGSQVQGEQHCVVSFLGVVRFHKHYDLLENIENAGRLTWVYWDKYNWPLEGAVATRNTLFVARRNRSTDENGPSGSGSSNVGVTHYIGGLDSKDGMGKIIYVKNGSEESVDSGQVLVETEPICYQLRDIKLTMKQKRILKNNPLILGQATLLNSDSSGENIAKAFGYSYNYSSFWGQGHGILKGLNMSITLANGTKYPDIWWAEKTNEKRESVYEVKVYLEPGTAVNVTLRGKYTEVEVPYNAQLISRYKDGKKLARSLNDIYREDTVVEVEPEFGPVYYLSNLTLVPTTTTTTTTTTESPIREPSVNGHENKDDDPDENLVIPPGRKGGENDMRGDGPLSLKNKLDDAAGRSAAPRILSSDGIPILFLAGILLLVGFPDRPTS